MHVHRSFLSPLVAPPFAPVLNVLQEAVPSGVVLLWSDDQLAAADCGDSSRCHILAVDVPLRLQQRLDNVVRLGATADAHGIRLLSDDEASPVELLVD